MNPVTLILTLAMFPPADAPIHTRSLRDAAKAATAAMAVAVAVAVAEQQTKSCTARAQEWVKECEAEEVEEARERDANPNRLPDRTGLGWTGLGLASAGAVHLFIGSDVSRWRHCGPTNANHCRNLERFYRGTGWTLLTTGVTFFAIDEVRRHRQRAARAASADSRRAAVRPSLASSAPPIRPCLDTVSSCGR